MTDYIEWILTLLDGEEEEEGTELRHGGGVFGMGRRAASDKADTATQRSEAVEESVRICATGVPWGGAYRLPEPWENRLVEVRRSEATGVKAADDGAVPEADDVRDTQGTRLLADMVAGHRKYIRREGLPEPASALWVYEALRTKARKAEWVREGTGKSIAPAAEAQERGISLRDMDPAALDRCFQRDARRYDGGFSLY